MEEIKQLILGLCEDRDMNWKNHIRSVVKYSKILARKLGADEDVCEIAAWLHDLKKLRGEKNNHHIYGAEESAEILEGLGYDKKKISEIKHCILTHSSDKNHPPDSIEAKIVASADALSHFDSFIWFTYCVFSIRKWNVEKGREWMINKYKKAWDKLLVKEAKQIAKPKYDAIKAILGEMDG